MFKWLKKRGTEVKEVENKFGRFRLFDHKRNLTGQEYGYNEVCNLDEKARIDAKIERSRKRRK